MTQLTIGCISGGGVDGVAGVAGMGSLYSPYAHHSPSSLLLQSPNAGLLSALPSWGRGTWGYMILQEHTHAHEHAHAHTQNIYSILYSILKVIPDKICI